MSILFPKVNKMPEWNFRPRFYDPEKEKRRERLQRLQSERAGSDPQTSLDNADGEHHTTLHRGSFREAREEKFPRKNTAQNTSRIAFWIALLVMLLFCFYYLF